MKRKRFSIEQIVAVLKQAELGMPVADVIRQVGISEQTFDRLNAPLESAAYPMIRRTLHAAPRCCRRKKSHSIAVASGPLSE